MTRRCMSDATRSRHRRVTPHPSLPLKGGGESTRRFPPPLRGRVREGGAAHAPLLRRRLELAQDGVAAPHGVVDGGLSGFLAGEGGLEILGPDVADLNEIAEAQAARVLGRRLVGELQHRRLASWMLLEETVLLERRERGLGDRHIARHLAELDLDGRLRQIRKELRDALVLRRGLAAHYPKARAANDRVLRRALDLGIVGQLEGRELELRVLLEIAIEARRRLQHAALAAQELALRLGVAAAIIEGLVLLCFGERRDVL